MTVRYWVFQMGLCSLFHGLVRYKFSTCCFIFQFSSFLVHSFVFLIMQPLDSVQVSSKDSYVPEKSPLEEDNHDITILGQAKSFREMRNLKLSFTQLEVSVQLNLLIAVIQDGQVLLCTTSKKGVRKGSDITAERWLGICDAVCAAVAHEQSILAVGSKTGDVNLFDLADNAILIRTISLYDWG